MTHINALPNEVLSVVLGLLPLRAVLWCRAVCSRWRLLCDTESLWRHLCQRDYRVGEQLIWETWTFKEFYQRVLHKFQHLPGWYTRDLRAYGGLLLIKLESDGINCYECLPPLDECYKEYEDIMSREIHILPGSHGLTRHSMRFRRLFSLKSVGRRLRLVCFQSDVGIEDNIAHAARQECVRDSSAVAASQSHSCSLDCLIEQPISRDEFKFVCENKEAHNRVHFNNWFQLEHGFRCLTEEAMERTVICLWEQEMYQYRGNKYRELAHAAGAFKATRLRSSSYMPARLQLAGAERSTASVLPKPGVYAGTYSVHGWELLLCTYEVHPDDLGTVAVFTKLSGDPNVPAGEVSFRVFCHRPIYMTPDDVTDWQCIDGRITAAAATGFAIEDWNAFTSQAFGWPDNTYVRLRDGHPGRCRSRFMAEGQVASPDFVDAQFLTCVYSQLSDVCVALLWADINNMAFYYHLDTQPDGT